MATILNNKQLLYSGFLDDHRTYHLVVAYWQRLFQQLLSATKLTFHPFYTKQDGSGQRDYGGNPIFDAYFPDLHKLVRIIQYLPESGDQLISAYLDHWPAAEMAAEQRPQPTDPDRSLAPIPELVIAIALTRETSTLAQELIRQWVLEDASEADMEEIIEAWG